MVPSGQMSVKATYDQYIVIATRKALARRLEFCPELGQFEIWLGDHGSVFHYDIRGLKILSPMILKCSRDHSQLGYESMEGK